mgnify:CR=1 FL=1
MSCNEVLFVGKVTSKDKKEKIAGAKVELVDPRTKSVLGFGVTGDDGDYLVRFSPDHDFLFFKSSSALIGVVDLDGKILAPLKKKSYKAGKVIVSNFSVPANKLKKFEPIAEPIRKIKGSIIEPKGLRIIETAISEIISKEGQNYGYFLNASICPLPDLAHFETLLEDAWEVIGGNPDSVTRFRQTLSLFLDQIPNQKGELIRKRSFEPTKKDSSSILFEENLEKGSIKQMIMSLAFPNIQSIPKNEINFCKMSSSELVTRERYIPIVVASLLIAESHYDAALLLSSLEAGLCGIRKMDALLEAAKESLAGDSRRFRNLLERFGSECGPDDGPPLPFPKPKPVCPPLPEGFPEFLPHELERKLCMLEAISVFLKGSHQKYKITSITPDRICAGRRIVIKGNNFGNNPGRVIFPSGYSRISVAPESWSDTEIKVIVPNDFVSGDVSLSILDDIIIICDRGVGIYRQKDKTSNSLLRGGTPAILRLGITEQRFTPSVEPDKDVHIVWSVVNEDPNSVRIRVYDGGLTLLDQNNLPSSGSLVFHTPAINQKKTLTVTCYASNFCGSDSMTNYIKIDVIPTLTIEGMEITQGIQTFPFRPNFTPEVTPNTLATIKNKDTIVRIYISADRSGFLDDIVENVTGYLKVDSNILYPINGTTPTNTNSNPFIEVRRKNEIDREETDHTLNFRVPSNLCFSTRTIEAIIISDEYDIEITQSMSWTWRKENSLPVRFVRIRDNRPAPVGTGTRPTRDQVRFTIQRAFDLLPSPADDIAPASTELWNTTRSFETNNGLQSLLDDIDDERSCSFWEWLFGDCHSDRDLRWVGFTTPFNRGWAYFTKPTAMSAIYQISDGQNNILRIKTGHELTHTLDFKHVNRSCGGGAPGGPFYPHPNNGDLVDVPFDPFWNQAISGDVQDFMSYGCTRWTSADSWDRLQGEI